MAHIATLIAANQADMYIIELCSISTTRLIIYYYKPVSVIL